MSAPHPVPSFAKNFPASTASPSKVFPFPGVTDESTKAVRRVLTENDQRYDIYESLRFAHNHFSHSVLTRYALGAPAKLLEDTWAYDEPHLVSLDPEAGDRKTDMSKVPKEVTRENWDDPKYLAFEGAYSRYLKFFHEEVTRLGPIETVKEYVFSPRANWGGHQPKMLARILAGFYHPIIHIGLGLEFRDRVMIAEGLAMACVHKVDLFEEMFPSDFPRQIYDSASSSSSSSPSTARSDTRSKDHWTLHESLNGPRQPLKGKSLLEIAGEVQRDPALKPVKYDPDMLMRDRFIGAASEGRGARLRELVGQWSLTDEELSDGPTGWLSKVEELAVLATLVTCATSRVGKPPRVDFFLMHALTSSIFIPSFLAVLTIPERRALLSAYGLATFQFSISRGRPQLSPEFIMSQPAFPTAPGTEVEQGRATDVLSDPSDKRSRNAWLSLIESCLYARDSHVPKSIRALAHHGNHFGAIPPGGFIGAFTLADPQKESFPGSSKLDGSIFLRGAGVVMGVGVE
ncbi:hypothetical protein EHS25_006199 [Saitozyma podzolica]|uniref:Oxidoreductase AflY n=1 Tax=Saitozyma podzolica TaxID=1890683 RepID=A0A427XRX1_9TREE|nr:hypothetical protein EHS25_006199 [Saitozyma podzolica]